MNLTPYVAALRDDLAAAAAVGDEATARAGGALAAALEPAVRLALMKALSDLASEISDQLDDASVDLRLSGREVRVAVERTDRSPEAAGPGFGGFFAGPSSSPFADAGTHGSRGSHGDRPGGSGSPFGPGGGPDVGDISRMTLRLVDQIKGQAERAAASQGMSLNSWVSQAVQGALRDAGRGEGWGGGWKGGWGGASRPGADGAPGGDGAATRGTGGTPDAAPGGPDEGPDDDPGADGGVQGWVRG